MRTKALLIAAAAFAAGIVTSSAQVYSQNVVGYVNVTLTGGTLSIICPALDADGTGTNNTVASVFGTNVTVGDIAYAFNGAGYDSLNFEQVGHGASAVTGWYLNGVATNSYALNPGRAVFYAASATETITITGTVLQGTTLTNQFIPGAGAIALVASQVPLSGGLTTVLGYTPNVGDIVYIYDQATPGGYDTYNYETVGHGAGATSGWYINGTAQEPQIAVGQGFWLQPAVATSWVQNFTVQ
jgi:hypothetical protein